MVGVIGVVGLKYCLEAGCLMLVYPEAKATNALLTGSENDSI